MRRLAEEEDVPLIDLTEITTRLYTAWGPVESTKAFVSLPCRDIPGQETDLEDNTHFNPYGGWQIAKCVVAGNYDAGLPLAQFVRPVSRDSILISDSFGDTGYPLPRALRSINRWVADIGSLVFFGRLGD